MLDLIWLYYWLQYNIPPCGGCHSQYEIDHWYGE